MALGDVMLDRYVGRAIDRYGVDYPLDKVRPLLKRADLVLANLECPLTTRPIEIQKHFQFRVPPDRVQALTGIDIVSVANNHGLDCGTEGLAETLRTLASAHIRSVGQEAQTPLIVNLKGLRVAFLAFSDFRDSLPGICHYDSLKASEAIASARRLADDVVVFMHWGNEGDPEPSYRQRAEANEMARSGVDLILGAHPHILQPVERIGKTVVAYSMGNFVFDSTRPDQAKTAIFLFHLGKDGAVDSSKIPCRIRGSRPVPAEPRTPRKR